MGPGAQNRESGITRLWETVILAHFPKIFLLKTFQHPPYNPSGEIRIVPFYLLDYWRPFEALAKNCKNTTPV